MGEKNSKSCILDEFKKFIKIKNELNKVLLEKYKEDIFRKYKWYGYINRKKAETDLARNIKNKFGKDVILIQGDWSDKLKFVRKLLKLKTTTIDKPEICGIFDRITKLPIFMKGRNVVFSSKFINGTTK